MKQKEFFLIQEKVYIQQNLNKPNIGKAKF